jgi:Zn-dependent alcohol dehydrogenase
VHNYTNGGIGTDLVKAPLCLGHETAGIVSAIGEDVTSFKVGDKVAIEPGMPVSFTSRYIDETD